MREIFIFSTVLLFVLSSFASETVVTSAGTNFALSPGGEKGAAGKYVPRGVGLKIVEKSGSWYRIFTESDTASLWVHESKIEISPEQIQRISEQTRSEYRKKYHGPRVIVSYSDIVPAQQPTPAPVPTKKPRLDKVVLRSGSRISCFVVEVSKDEVKIKYQGEEFLEVLKTEDVDRIVFSSGRVKKFGTPAGTTKIRGVAVFDDENYVRSINATLIGNQTVSSRHTGYDGWNACINRLAAIGRGQGAKYLVVTMKYERSGRTYMAASYWK